MKNIAIVLAGGSGSRFGADMPKQFLQVAGKMIIEHTIDAFERHPLIDEIAVVSRADYVDEMKEMVKRDGYRKVTKVLQGGKERYHSSLAAIEAFTCDDDNLLIHDGVRPFVTDRIITDCVKALADYEAVDVAVPATDTVIELHEDGSIARIPPRRLLRNAQTPQCFRRRVIAKAFELALKDPGFFPTDDCSLVLKYMPEVAIKVVDGDPTNIKITYKEDIEMMKRVITDR
jgi:2-C-methyl-D-erythritol 4-phosphate cytidylyltransferase